MLYRLLYGLVSGCQIRSLSRRVKGLHLNSQKANYNAKDFLNFSQILASLQIAIPCELLYLLFLVPRFPRFSSYTLREPI